MFQARVCIWRHKPADRFTDVPTGELSVITGGGTGVSVSNQDKLVSSKWPAVPQLTQIKS